MERFCIFKEFVWTGEKLLYGGKELGGPFQKVSMPFCKTFPRDSLGRVLGWGDSSPRWRSPKPGQGDRPWKGNEFRLLYITSGRIFVVFICVRCRTGFRKLF
jgi:hypothetical protein